MRMDKFVEGLLRTINADPPPPEQVASEIIDIAIRDQSAKRLFAPEAKTKAVAAMLAEYEVSDQIDAASRALLDCSLPLETYCCLGREHEQPRYVYF